MKSLPSSESVKRYQQVIFELFMNCLKEVSSEFDFLPRYGFLDQLLFEKYSIFGIFLFAASFAIYVDLVRKGRAEFGRGMKITYYFYALIAIFCFYGIIHGRGFSLPDVTSRVKLLATIRHFSPGNNISKWDEIARHRNYYLCSRGVSYLPRGCFSD